MKSILVIVLAIGLVSADIGIGYHYKVPQTSYGSPVYQTGTGSNGYSTSASGLSSVQGHQGSFGQHNNGYQSSGSVGHHQAGTGYQATNYNTGPSVVGLSSSGSNSGYQSNGYTTGYSGNGGSSGHGNTGFQGSGFNAGPSVVGLSSGSSNVKYQTNGYTAGSSGAGSSSGHTNTGFQNTGYNVGSTGSNTGYQNIGYTGQNSASGLSALGLNGGSSNTGYNTDSFSNVQPTYQTNGNINQGYQTQSQYQTSQAHKYNYNYVQQQPAQIFKHFYVHAAPEEQEEVKTRQPLVLPAPQKHYKIIFIKTPTQKLSSSQYLQAVQQQNEEKTIVYVLVNKPEGSQNVDVPNIPAPKPPSKPEVYFIKYNTKEGSQGVINNIVNGFNKDSNSVSYSETDASNSDASLTDVQALSSNSGTASGHSTVSSLGSASSSIGNGAVTDQQGQYEQQSSGVSSLGSASSSSGTGAASLSNYGNKGSYNGAVTVQQGQYEQQSSGVSSGTQVADGTINSIAHVGNISGGEVTESTISGSTVGYQLATGQGIPHQNYGPPSFRND